VADLVLSYFYNLRCYDTLVLTERIMATIVAQAPAGVMLAVSGITPLSDSRAMATNIKAVNTPLSDSLIMANNIKAAITAFASDSGLQMLSQLIDRIPELNKDIVKKDGQIQELSAQLATGKENHFADQQKQLQVFADMYDAWRDEKARLQSTAEGRQKDLEEKIKEMTALQATLDDLKIKAKNLETKLKEKVSILKEKEQKIEALEKLHQKVQANAEEYSVKLGQSRIRVTQQETILGDYKAEHERLKKEYATTKKERDEVLGYSAPMNEVNLGNM
jgi:chromosome segregation ATPase